MKSVLLAPCGINCGVCIAYLRKKNTCPGCRMDFAEKPVTRFRCYIKNCCKSKNVRYCFACPTFPCQKIKQMDKRYRTKYKMSIIENLEHMKKNGVRAYLKNEIARWSCPSCGGIICVHKGYCLSCGKTTP
ncbi:MAG TPA: DUF3795 domain-containing protein [Candidatus Thermoplasmatota archaeon]|nr:DUF3795 domain-containing protein [Candidatus Thermoplasmatota archaeon]